MDNRSQTINGRSAEKSAKKRAQPVTVACEACRRRKIKCDGQRPCSACVNHTIQCLYNAAEGETRWQAAKRKYDEVERERDELVVLLEDLLSKDDRNALRMLDRLRAERDGDGILTTRGSAQGSRRLSGEQLVQHLVLVSLALSTAALPDIIEFVNSYASSTSVAVPADFSAIFNRIIQPEALIRLVKGASIPRQLGSAESQHTINVGHDEPTYLVPAAPWTDLTRDDTLFSRLISTFINYVNPYWRYIEEDLFLEGLRSGQPGVFCSRFLVHAMCALACLHCEYPEAFVEPGNYVTRGMQFHEEALRLWSAEIGRPKLTNLQALSILAIDFGHRAKDKQTRSMISEAIRLNRDLPLEAALGLSGLTSPYSRARISVAWAIHHLDVTCNTGLLTSSEDIDPRLSLLPSFADSVSPWSGKPYMRTILTFRRNTLSRETCMLTRLRSDMNKLLFTQRQNRTKRAFSQDVDKLVTRFQVWYENMPADFRYRKDLILPLYELHAEYFCAMLLLCSATESSMDGHAPRSFDGDKSDAQSDSQYDAVIAAKMSSISDAFALRTASLLRDYREMYSLKVTLAFIFQCESYASFALLRRLRRMNESNNAYDVGGIRTNVEAAFEECFRCLLGTGTQMMMARGVSRMVTQTARDFGVKLPANVLAVLPALETWQAKDLDEISSTYPNLAIASDAQFKSEAQMEEVLRKLESVRIEEVAPSGSVP